MGEIHSASLSSINSFLRVLNMKPPNKFPNFPSEVPLPIEGGKAFQNLTNQRNKFPSEEARKRGGKALTSKPIASAQSHSYRRYVLVSVPPNH